MPPRTDMEDWNQADTQGVNSSYNYATDNLNRAEKGSNGKPTKKVRPARPGGTRDLDPFKFKWDPQAQKPKRRITCKSLKTACVEVDKLKDDEHCATHPECWRIAYFIKTNANELGDGFHFAREDRRAEPPSPPNPGKPAKWSHKFEGEKATDKCYNPDTKKFDGPTITDPENQKLYPGYEFCGYLCVCPENKVAYLEPWKLIEEGESLVSLAEVHKTKEGV